MQSVADIKAVLASLGKSPKRSLGQNFLIDHSKIAALVERAGVGSGDLVLEVGPGTGALTDDLVERGCVVVAVELDDAFAAHVRDRFATTGCVRVIHDDCLQRKGELSVAASVALDDLGASERGYRLVANLPYGAASALMVAAAWDERCAGQYVTIQRDVAQRVRASPGSRDYSELTVMIGAVSEAERIATLRPGCFWPAPNVTSEMIQIEPRPAAGIRPGDDGRRRLERVCRTLFTQRRKTLRSILGDVDWPQGVDGGMRPENVPIDALVTLSSRVDPPA